VDEGESEVEPAWILIELRVCGRGRAWLQVEGVVWRDVTWAFWRAFGGIGKGAGCKDMWEGFKGDEVEELYDQGDEERRCIPPILQSAANASNVVYSYIAMKRGGVHYTWLHPATNTASYAQTQRLVSSAMV